MPGVHLAGATTIQLTDEQRKQTLRVHRSATITIRVRAASTGALVDRAVVGTATLDPDLSNTVDQARIRVTARPRPHGPCGSARDLAPLTARIAC